MGRLSKQLRQFSLGGNIIGDVCYLTNRFLEECVVITEKFFFTQYLVGIVTHKGNVSVILLPREAQQIVICGRFAPIFWIFRVNFRRRTVRTVRRRVLRLLTPQMAHKATKSTHICVKLCGGDGKRIVTFLKTYQNALGDFKICIECIPVYFYHLTCTSSCLVFNSLERIYIRSWEIM